MFKRVTYFLLFFLYWTIFFIILRFYFIVSNFEKVANISLSDIIGVFSHGIIMDFSAAGYLMVIPGIILTISFITSKKWINHVLFGYMVIIVILISFLAVVDAELYKYWGFRLDTTPILYIKTPKDALASVSFGLVAMQLIIFAILCTIFIFLYKKTLFKQLVLSPVKLYFSPVMLFLTACLIIPIRGGFGIAPMNVGRVYFSQSQFANHAAVNLFWNVGFSITELKDISKKYNFFDDAKATGIVKVYLNQNTASDSVILKTKRPNIIILIVESFTSKIIGSLGGIPNITPEFNHFSKDGILFTNFYASGDRSDKGIIAILSGYPAQTSTSIINYATKTHSLPKMASILHTIGYNTSFYYGGDINFANMRSYLLDSNYDKIVSQDSFSSDTYNSKWGTHDHIVFNKMYSDLNATPQPFFANIFTLSNHEPFEIPGKSNLNKTIPEKFLQSAYYTDSCIGDFIKRSKKTKWWDNTLIIIVADHGHQQPDNPINHSISNYKIPMLWLGGALKTNGIISKFGTQIDIASTLLAQLKLPSNKFIFSKNILGNEKAFGYYIFNNGFGLMTDTTKVVYDCNGNRKIFQEGHYTDSLEILGKSYLQYLYTDMGNR